MMPKRSLEDRIIDADTRASQWLADANEARGCGAIARAIECESKSQFWRDRYNYLTGAIERPAPKH